ncbi:MAG TPA: HNH endonuclease [Kofleriaceae bacterium]|nr:HNH endonuclease [Kofleriaceae bacterium]
MRGPEPELLAREGAQIGRDYATRRRETPSHRFQWPRRDGQSLYEVVRAALAIMTQGRCSYCDGHPIDATGAETVDHFQPKSYPEFYELVCTWSNLFLTCTACNHAKREQWDAALLRPDDPEFAFERYFEYRFDSGELRAAPTASPADRQRAERTIEVFDLNRAGTCESRKRMVREMRRPNDPISLDDCAYRYLWPLCRPS